MDTRVQPLPGPVSMMPYPQLPGQDTSVSSLHSNGHNVPYNAPITEDLYDHHSDNKAYSNHSNGDSYDHHGNKVAYDTQNYRDTYDVASDLSYANENINSNNYGSENLNSDDYLNDDGLADEGDARFQCKICDKKFAVLPRLQRHNRIHTGEKPFKCEYCEKTFSVKENLNVHRRVHTKERPYQCNICSRGFEHSGKLHRHMRTHTGERPHRCQLCGKTFVQSGQLVIHMRSHTGEKPYTCEYCQKGFTCSKQLKVHIRTHTGEKPYECDVCGKTFGYNHVLKMHKMSHLGEKLYKCTLCEEFFNSRKALDKHIKEHEEDPFAPAQTVNNQINNVRERGRPKGSKKVAKKLSPLLPPQPSSGLPAAPPPLCPLPQAGSPIHNFQSREELPVYKEIRRGAPGPICGPLTPPHSPDNPGSPRTPPNRSPVMMPQSLEDNWSRIPNTYFPQSGMLHSPQVDPSQLAFFITVTGERIACPVSQLIRLPGMESTPLNLGIESRSLQVEYRETLKMQKELKERLQLEEIRKERESEFSNSVYKVLESCIGSERLQKLGYPKYTIDEVILKILQIMGTQPCWEPSLTSMDRIKVNLRLLLECCIPDKELWDKFGWKGKSIEDIVAEFPSNKS